MARNYGGNWEDLGRGWGHASNVVKPTGKMRARYYEDDGKVILGPNGETIARGTASNRTGAKEGAQAAALLDGAERAAAWKEIDA